MDERRATSDELREFAYLHFSGIENIGPCDALMGIADRIDAEMVELPKSADGKIWTGREVCFWTGATEGDRHEFNSLPYINGRWCVEDKHWQRYPAASVWYERPDSWERIAHDLDDWTAVLADCDVDAAHEFAERVRKLAKKED